MPFTWIFANAQNNPMKWVLPPFCKKLRLREVKYLPQLVEPGFSPGSLTFSPLTLLSTKKEVVTDWILGAVA